ncbi:hypothetical protein [Pseudosporangium ferrugineum]|uniref:Nucleoside-diphosphate-sugar epimerase n=1 Tax=Pseudosporangium ferrugineum TaxID=439699 RepID=A0A2T0RHU0_9ACTN|nr:hypothetical protein [Pseudosporangium ferrugineum]PRY20786.1 nucleoside-diphosphate-sugar epimerase [Pseudosporangium ferrugineum]
MHVLVTGGTLAPAVISELLAAGHTVTDRAGAEDLSSADGVIHLGGPHAAETDLNAIRAIGTALINTGRPFIGTGTTAAPALAGFTGVLTEEIALPGEAENALLAYASSGVRAAVVRLPPAVHESGRYGAVSGLIAVARATGVSGCPGDGGNRWPAVDARDAARLYRLALESAPPGARLHAVAEEGIAMRDIAEAIAGRLHVPVAGVDARHFGTLAGLAGLDNPVSGRATRDALGWAPSRPGLIAALGRSTVLNVGLDPSVVGDPGAPSEAFPAVDAAQVRAGIERAAAELAGMGLDFDSCLLDRGEGAEAALRDTLNGGVFDVIVIGAGVRLEPSLTPLFEKLIGIVRTHAPESRLAFNTGPDSLVDAVRRALPIR